MAAYEDGREVLGQALASRVSKAIADAGGTNKVTFGDLFDELTKTESRLPLTLVDEVRATLARRATLYFPIYRG